MIQAAKSDKLCTTSVDIYLKDNFILINYKPKQLDYINTNSASSTGKKSTILHAAICILRGLFENTISKILDE